MNAHSKGTPVLIHMVQYDTEEPDATCNAVAQAIGGEAPSFHTPWWRGCANETPQITIATPSGSRQPGNCAIWNHCEHRILFGHARGVRFLPFYVLKCSIIRDAEKGRLAGGGS